MTDPQLMTLALAIIIPLSLLLYSNSWITEAKETLRAEMVAGNGRITEMKEALRAEMATGNNRITDVNSRITDVKETLRAEMAAGFSRISSEILSLKADLKVHELEHHRR
jgi:predicted  nucleic acid-binding Zn-ribbon protein